MFGEKDGKIFSIRWARARGMVKKRIERSHSSKSSSNHIAGTRPMDNEGLNCVQGRFDYYLTVEAMLLNVSVNSHGTLHVYRENFTIILSNR